MEAIDNDGNAGTLFPTYALTIAEIVPSLNKREIVIQDISRKEQWKNDPHFYLDLRSE